MIEIPKYYAEQISSKTNLDLFPLWQRMTGKLFRLEDEINIFAFKKNLLDGTLPIYDLELKPSDLLHLDNTSKAASKQGYISDDINEWRKAKLLINGNEYSVKMRYHGDTPFHWSYELKSYQIKTDKTQYIDRERRFNLIIFEDREFAPLIGRLITSRLGLMDIRGDLVVLRINGVTQGVYILQEKIDTTFAEYNGCSSCYAISLRDNWVTDHKYDVASYHSADPNGIFWETGHRTAFDYEIANVNINYSESDMEKILYRLSQLFDKVNSKDPEIIEFFDKEQLRSFHVFRAITGNLHSIVGDNFRMIYKATDSKFYPVPLIEATTRLKLEKGGIDHYLNTFGKPVDLFYILANNDELRYLTHKKLYSFIMNNTVLEDYDNLIQKYGHYVLSYKTNRLSRRQLKYDFKEQRDILQNNIKIIKKNLDYSKFYANILEKNNDVMVELIPDSIAEIKFKKFILNLQENFTGDVAVSVRMPNNLTFTRVKMIKGTNNADITELIGDLYFSAGVDDNLYPSIRKYPIKITFSDTLRIGIVKADLVMVNDINGRTIPDDDSYIEVADANNFYPNYEHQTAMEFMNNSKMDWKYSDGVITLKKGTYLLNDNLIIPKLDKVIIEPGVNVRIAENKSILSYTPIIFNGTKENPIIITSIYHDKPYGTFAIVGEGNQGGNVTINWLDVSNGNQDWINGMFFSGQISIHHIPNVIINNSAFHNGHADDGINVKYSNIVVENSKFYSNSADQFDMDFNEGIVKNSIFDGSGDLNSNGDGLDLSGSQIILKNSQFINNRDKGISVGEDTKILVFHNNIDNNKIGTAVKDLSHGYYIDNNFRNNEIAVDVYQKKQLFGGAYAYIYKNYFGSNGQDFNKDNLSRIYKTDIPTESYNKLIKNAENEKILFLE